MTGEINYEQLGRIACCSTYHYQRMFTYMAGITLAEYIRRRKMSLAAVDLQGGDERIIDIAEKYGYRSLTAFNRAFQSFHGIYCSCIYLGNLFRNGDKPVNTGIGAADYNRVASGLWI